MGLGMKRGGAFMMTSEFTTPSKPALKGPNLYT